MDIEFQLRPMERIGVKAGQVVAILLVSGAFTGCGQDGLMQIKARIMLDGKPLDRAAVTFMSTGASARRPATGMTQPDGFFQLTTYHQNDGVFPGEYKVCVSKTAPTVGVSNPTASSSSPENVSYEEYFAAASKWSGKQNSAPPAQEVPEIYRSPERTPLTCHVPNDSDIVVFDLKSQPDLKGH